MEIIRFAPKSGAIDPEITDELRRRGVQVAAEEEAQITLACLVCDNRWQVARERFEKPTDVNHFWWCSNGCNREE